ncbi:BREX-1 system adenine-specific DNA-methyltransferase PglX [Aeromonas caviae]|uniref:BREX-1 system adenine-specific DNA-methyltransferase PglX n=1 Tax=Aeromonas caviae TaxID=648 RepID=UPI002E7B1905|nr:BREX-1 system adenine-specific DNA-methyltransferase PglX [Aeromonas caviae]MEE1914301.1 BREX-1 system adenine-specific DNA-methyltransferase PglX [Aeromonas caviae]
MNTNNLKKVAPRARTAFIKAITARAGEFGITAKGVSAPTISGDVLQVAGFTHPARFAPAITRLQERVASEGFAQLIEQMAYTWFNRFCAIRFMELKSEEGYLEHGVRLLSHPTQPQGFEVLDRAPEVIESLMSEGVSLDKSALLELMLAGNEQETLFRELLLGQCHRLHQAMPFLFEAIDDETELLLPNGLTRTDAFWRELVDGIPEEDWTQVEVIGWLYQFYISEKKDEVIGKVVKSEDIPAATQLFTPNWIVQYLVQNSVGRYWLQTYPDSPLQKAMPYYVAPGEQPDEVLAELAQMTPASIEPESIKVLDPACGSGHILVEAYNLLYRIYEERGYRSRDIPQLILTHNLFGLDIDDRAAQLAGFALLMRARQDDRRLFSREIQLNVHALQESRHLNILKLWQALNLNAEWDRGQSQDLFAVAPASLASNDPRLALLNDLHQRFLSAKTLGSLIEVPAEQAPAIAELAATLHTLSISGDVMQKPAAQALLPLLKQASVLAKRYDAVIANPPYMGSNGMNADLKEFAKNNFPNSKSNLFAIFMERTFELLTTTGFNAQVNLQTWMFLSGFSKFRERFIKSNSLICLNHIGLNSFPEMNSKVVQCCAFVSTNKMLPGYVSKFYDLTRFPSSSDKNKCFLGLKDESVYSLDISRFMKVPGSPFCYWNDYSNLYVGGVISDVFESGGRCKTHDDEKYVRCWWEIDFGKIGLEWRFYEKGGDYRPWFGNRDFVVNWTATAKAFYESHGGLTQEKFWGKEAITWSAVTTSRNAFRLKSDDSEYSSGSPCLFATESLNDNHIYSYLGLLNSTLSHSLLQVLCPTINANPGDILNMPNLIVDVSHEVKRLVDIYRVDWCSQEQRFGFTGINYISLKSNGFKYALETSFSDEEKLVDEALELDNSVDEKISSKFGFDYEVKTRTELPLFCNFMYKKNDLDEATKSRRSNAVQQVISYSIACMMGRYSLDREGLVYAHAGNEGFKALVEEGAYATFAADEDGILPLSTDSWFEDDVATRLEAFVCTVWGKETLEENLQFIADSLCLSAIKPVKKGGETSRETLRRYLSTQFYKDHLKTYKKRPIYWLFSSGKEKAFECLVYLHRYNEATLPRMRTEYVTPLLGQMAGRIERLRLQQTEASTSDAKRIGKEIDSLTKQLSELRAFDDQLKHHADMRITLDLDDGVKVNYGKFGTLLSDVKAITGDKGE